MMGLLTLTLSVSLMAQQQAVPPQKGNAAATTPEENPAELSAAEQALILEIKSRLSQFSDDFQQLQMAGSMSLDPDAKLGINKNFDKKIAKGKIDEAQKTEWLSHLKATTTLEDLADVDIVFEAMVENMDLKKDAFEKMAGVIKPEAVFVSNTSSLSITELAAASGRPAKFLGMHFFSPVPAMKLVEIINAYDTSEDTIETGKAIAKGFGKEFVTVSDVPMFIANRVMCPMMNEAAILAGENVCSYEDIDKACELGYNQPMGPLKLADAIGIDVMISVMESLYQETADSKYRPAHLYKVLYRAGRLGRKSGKGFYDYE